MGEVRYSINGKYFKDFGVYISSSDGLFDALKRKKANSYDWAEYHGSAPDLSNPKFEAREITLVGFVVGENWEVMKSNFDAIISEFQKAGTQRLLIEPLGLKTLPYEVYCDDATPLNKTFREGKTIGTFTLKLIEPNPIKKVLYFTGNTLNLSYDCPNETEIFYGNGLKETAKGNVNFTSKNLANRVVSGYNYLGRNIILKSSLYNIVPSLWFPNPDGSANTFNGNMTITGDVLITPNFSTPLENGKTYTFSFDALCFQNNKEIIVNFNGKTLSISVTLGYERKYFTFIYDSSKNKTTIYLYAEVGFGFSVGNLKLEKNDKGNDWTTAPEDEKYIVIAGNVEDITDLTANAKVLWEKL